MAKRSRKMAKGSCGCTSNHRKYCKGQDGRVRFKKGRC